MAEAEVWLPTFVILNYRVARQNDNADGPIICDENWRMEFHATMGPSDHALLLYDIRMRSNDRGNPVYSAHVAGEASRNLVSTAHAPPRTLGVVVDEHERRQGQEINKHALLYIHGFNSHLPDVFASCHEYHLQYPNRIVIPVLWAGENAGVLGYLTDRQTHVPEAVRSFVQLLDEPNAFPKRSLICHSMGNFLLQGMARAYQQLIEGGGWPRRREHCFEYIFMVAADVNAQLFDKTQNQDPIRSNNHGLCVVDLVSGSVHVLYSPVDEALLARIIPNFGEHALGRDGYVPASLHGEAATKLASRNCTYASKHCGDRLRHSYFFHNDLIQYYEHAMDPEINDQNSPKEPGCCAVI